MKIYINKLDIVGIGVTCLITTLTPTITILSRLLFFKCLNYNNLISLLFSINYKF